MCARMIPSLGPAEHDDRSHEGEIYYALSKLPDDFTVIHSFRILDVVKGKAIEVAHLVGHGNSLRKSVRVL
jgi:hypothetical protein